MPRVNKQKAPWFPLLRNKELDTSSFTEILKRHLNLYTWFLMISWNDLTLLLANIPEALMSLPCAHQSMPRKCLNTLLNATLSLLQVLSDLLYFHK